VRVAVNGWIRIMMTISMILSLTFEILARRRLSILIVMMKRAPKNLLRSQTTMNLLKRRRRRRRNPMLKTNLVPMKMQSFLELLHLPRLHI